jgi:hypothetical protein
VCYQRNQSNFRLFWGLLIVLFRTHQKLGLSSVYVFSVRKFHHHSHHWTQCLPCVFLLYPLFLVCKRRMLYCAGLAVSVLSNRNPMGLKLPKTHSAFTCLTGEPSRMKIATSSLSSFVKIDPMT